MSAQRRAVRMPSWLNKRLPDREAVRGLSSYLKSMSIETVCVNARCPNIGECHSAGNVSFLILGNICTRNCHFCAIHSGRPSEIDPKEPAAIAEAVCRLKLRYVVITSVARDDMADGGSGHYAEVVRMIKKRSPAVTVETLVPDLNGSRSAIDRVLDAGTDVFSHNMEAVERLFAAIRPEYDYRRSLEVLRYASSRKKAVIKSGFMVGLGERSGEIERLLTDLRDSGCTHLTIGQYLMPRGSRLEVKDFIRPEGFKALKQKALDLGIEKVASGPFVRSSYMAEALLT